MKRNVKLVFSELLKNSKKSDREVSKAVGISQPTVTRCRNKLEKEGYILSYSAIPEWSKLGFEIVVFSIVKISSEFIEKLMLDDRVLTILKTDGDEAIVLSVHKNYTDYYEMVKDHLLESYLCLTTNIIKSFNLGGLLDGT